MNRKFAILAALLLLVIGGVITAIALSGDSSETDSKERAVGAGDTPERPEPGSSSGGFKPETGATSAAAEARATERAQRNSELVETYGESRTNLARHVSENVVSLLDDAIGMGEMMIRSDRFGGGDRQLRQLTERNEIELTEEQQERASELIAEFQERRLDETRDAVDSLRDDPTKLMSLVLAGDARARGDLTEAEYAALQQANADALGDVINPLDRDNFQPRDPMRDETFRDGFTSILDAGQAEKLATSAADTEPEDANRTAITDMPVMDLEQLDETIRSTKQVTAGFRQAMEGMQSLGPLEDQLRESREDSEGGE